MTEVCCLGKPTQTTVIYACQKTTGAILLGMEYTVAFPPHGHLVAQTLAVVPLLLHRWTGLPWTGNMDSEHSHEYLA